MTTGKNLLATLFSRETLDALFPKSRTDQFFDALLGDASEGAYDIRLTFREHQPGRLVFDLELHQRPRKCLACNLTYGLPKVFARHPIINIQGVVDQIGALLDGHGRCAGWQLGNTVEISRQLHVVPLIIELEKLVAP